MNVKIAVAMLTSMNVAVARQTASDSVNFQMASVQSIVQAANETVIMMNEMVRACFGSSTPRSSVFAFVVISEASSLFVGRG